MALSLAFSVRVCLWVCSRGVGLSSVRCVGRSGLVLVEGKADVADGMVVELGVDVLHVASAEGDDELGDGGGIGGGDEQVDVVAHQGVGVQCAMFFVQGSVKPVQVGVVILFGKEAGLAVVAALHDVQRDVVEVDAGEGGAWHEQTLLHALKKIESRLLRMSCAN